MAYETEYSQHVLANGLRLVVASRPWSRTFAASLSLRVGWRDETAAQPGITHLVEHLAFCGANRDLTSSLGRQGLYLNAQTEAELTNFMLSGHASLMADGFKFFHNALNAIAADDATVDQEVEILGHELAYSSESPVDLEMRKLTARIIGEKNFGRPVLSTLKGLRRLKPPAVVEFHKQWFTPSNACLTIVSPAGTPDILALAEQSVGAVPERAVQRPDRKRDEVRLPPLISISTGGDYVLVLLLHHYHPPSLHPVHAVVMLSDLLGGDSHSVLFRTIREEARMAYSVGSNLTFMSDCAILDVFALVPRKQVCAALDKMLVILDQMQSRGLDAAIFEDARGRLVRSLDLFEDNPLELCNFLAFAPLHEAPLLLTPAMHRQNLATFSLEEANRIAADVLKPDRRVAVLMGPAGWLTRWRAKRRLNR